MTSVLRVQPAEAEDHVGPSAPGAWLGKEEWAGQGCFFIQAFFVL